MDPSEAVVRPLSGTEVSWFRAVPTGTGITVLAVLLSRPLPVHTLETALHNLQISHAILNTSLSPTSVLASTTPLTLPPSNPLPTRINALHSVLERELNINPWTGTSTPRNYFATLYEGGEGEDTTYVIALRFHTAICDRTSAVTLLKELLGLVGEGEESVREGEGEVRKGVEDMIRKEDLWKPFWVRGKDLLGYSVNGLRSAGLTFQDTRTERTSEVVRMVVGDTDTKTILNVSSYIALPCLALPFMFTSGESPVYTYMHPDVDLYR